MGEKFVFEEAMQQLREKAQLLENGSLSLEESTDCYKQAIELIAACEEHLDLTEQRVEELANQLNIKDDES